MESIQNTQNSYLRSSSRDDRNYIRSHQMTENERIRYERYRLSVEEELSFNDELKDFDDYTSSIRNDLKNYVADYALLPNLQEVEPEKLCGVVCTIKKWFRDLF